jgi:hypothetical protein
MKIPLDFFTSSEATELSRDERSKPVTCDRAIKDNRWECKMKFYRNRKGGSGTVELAPALVVIFIVILIPMLDLLYLGLAYAAGWYCNHLVVREVACRIPSVASGAGSAAGDATAAWANTGLAKFIGANSGSVTNTITFAYPIPPPNPVPVPPNGASSTTVSTSVLVQPFLPIPFFMKVEGLNKPVIFTYSAERPQEEKGIQ